MQFDPRRDIPTAFHFIPVNSGISVRLAQPTTGVYPLLPDDTCYLGQHFWARGYYVSTVGRDEDVIREYIRHQEAEDRRVDQLKLTAGLQQIRLPDG